ncbi:MAG: response regulator [Roseibium album]|uniref:response regulator transcription factor n=1 Tax=Roseibium album TaxID=311410 RepID=UPI00248FB9DF|nr:response regulator [Roseibium album]MCR9056568.1 response regulator [Paracoccaceae bacterium]
MCQILLIDDMQPVRHAIAATLRKAGHDVVETDDGNKGLEIAAKRQFDLIITDIMMPASDGTDVVFALKSGGSGPKVVAMSGGGSGIPAQDALSLSASRADAVLKKPFTNEVLIETVSSLTSN